MQCVFSYCQSNLRTYIILHLNQLKYRLFLINHFREICFADFAYSYVSRCVCVCVCVCSVYVIWHLYILIFAIEWRYYTCHTTWIWHKLSRSNILNTYISESVRAGPKLWIGDVYRFKYSPSNDTTATVVLRDLDIHVQDETSFAKHLPNTKCTKTEEVSK